MTYLLLPGRQIVTTRFQEEYLTSVLSQNLETLPTITGTPPQGRATNIVFAVTSCNKSNSRYNPLPFEFRAILAYEFARDLQQKFGVRFHIFGVPHYPVTQKFAEIILKEIAEQSDGHLTLTPANTVVFTSTPAVIEDYQALGFSILPGEYDLTEKKYIAPVPNAIVQQLGDGQLPLADIPLSRSARTVFTNFPDTVERIVRLFHDPILTEQGDLTETRNYGTYARDMAGAIDFKYAEILPFLHPGKIVDEGCADGALLERMVSDFPDSDLIGIDLSAEMLARAAERKRAGAFGGAFVFFKQQNLMTPVTEAQSNTTDTIICNSTLHELWSYGHGAETVREYLKNKHKQLRTGGRLVVRDVVGPENGDQLVHLWCNPDNGECTENVTDTDVAQLCTWSRFLRFVQDFRPGEPRLEYTRVQVQDGQTLFALTLRAGMEFIAKMDYTDNWQSEMHETFCFWDFPDWTRELADASFTLVPGSHAYLNPWRVQHSFTGKVRLTTPDGQLLAFPATNLVLAAEKPR
ncbi:MAG: methyltransferase domain-containing protein [Armatimonadota bacterium]|nr:methyltransferase domain-containing protein [Armatimonadota bacterium]